MTGLRKRLRLVKLGKALTAAQGPAQKKPRLELARWSNEGGH